MTHAAALSSRPSLHIASEISSATQRIADNSNHKIAFDLAAFYSQSTAFIYNERVRVSFAIKAEHVKQFGLIRGLIEFYRPKHLKFVFDPAAKSFETDLPLYQADEFKAFLTKISHALDHEIEFKTVLKKVIAFESRYKKDRDQLYSLQQTTLLAV